MEDVLLLQETMNVQELQCSQCRNYLQIRKKAVVWEILLGSAAAEPIKMCD